jgi:hypothetical protein
MMEGQLLLCRKADILAKVWKEMLVMHMISTIH